MIGMKCFLPIIVLSAATASHAGELVSYSKIGTVTSAYAINALKTRGTPTFSLPAVSKPIDVYKVRYRSRAVDGRPVTLSGMVALPQGGAPKGVVVFYHGTTADRNYVPSRYNCTDTPGESEAAVVIFGSGGYAVFMPDYLGLGDDKSFHPYPLGSINCWSGIDMIDAGKSLASKLTFKVGEKLYVTGYSEGGAVAMWGIRMLDKSKDYDLTAGAPLSGPYDLSGAQMKLLISKQSNPEILAACVYFGSYFAYSIQQNFPQYDIDLNNYFAPSFASYVPLIFTRGGTDETIAKALAVKALQLGTLTTFKTLITKQFLQAVQAVDISDPMVAQTVANDCYDWSPTTPTLLVHLYNDFIVSPQNTLNAVAAMRVRGVTEDVMRSYTITQKGLTHTTAAWPAAVMARRFFDGGFGSIPRQSN